MRILMMSAAAAAMFAASPALADLPSNTASTNVSAVAVNSCTIDSAESDMLLGAVGVSVPGKFNYTCNFDGAKNVYIKSDNGAAHTDANGGANVQYGVYLNTAAPGDTGAYDPVSKMAHGNTYYAILNDGHGAKNAYLAVALKDALPVAGTYSDVLHFTIVP